ncbi:MAG: acetyl-CoA carboxylase biotin carboxyl carrier protein [Chloroflexota bacterium]|nr:acetyl-CoA carboxylase biotin carboxyl carrier protein [Chloroflexota bacterium]
MVRLPDKGSDDRQAGGDAHLPSLADLSQEVKELVRLISATDVNELQIESGQVRIVIKRGAVQAPAGNSHGGMVYTPPATLPAPAANSLVELIGHSPAHGEDIVVNEGEQLIVAPMVGTFYAASAPTEPPYVSEGDVVEPGQVVGIIEAMKMMNEIESEVSGRLARILVQNAQPVEYGQPLMVVQTNGV